MGRYPIGSSHRHARSQICSRLLLLFGSAASDERFDREGISSLECVHASLQVNTIQTTSGETFISNDSKLFVWNVCVWLD